MAIDFEAVNRAALSRAETLLAEWLPGGQVQGNEYRAGDLTGSPGQSLGVSLETGVWSDFASDDSGSDLISLYAAIRGIKQGEAARRLGEIVGVTNGAAPARKSSRQQVNPVMPVPGDAPPPPEDKAFQRDGQWERHPIVAKWAYRDAKSRLMFYVARFELPNGKKEVHPVIYGTRQGKTDWYWQAAPKPRPLYNLDTLAARPQDAVLVVEGEKCAEAATLHLPEYVATTWPGGSSVPDKADWSPLQGRHVVLWPDADPAGHKAMNTVANLLDGVAETVSVVTPPADAAKGWDVADAAQEGWTAEDLLILMCEAAPREPMPEPPPPDEGYEPMPTGGPIQALGYKTGVYYYMPRGTKQVEALSGAGHTKAALIQLAPLRYWERDHGDDYHAAADWLMRQCEAAGVYDPTRIRGRGAWHDEGRVVLHMGNHLIVDGQPMDIEAIESRYIYEASATLPLSLENPLSNAEAVALRTFCEKLPWEQPLSGLLFSGWCVLAPFCGAFAWRPHVWITGGYGTGKTWILHHIGGRMLGEMGIEVTSETSEAGLRQTLGSDALPVLFDEIEGTGRKAQQKVQNVLGLLRQASSETGAAIIKGGANGKAISYRIRSMAALASIGVGIDLGADASRIAVLALLRPNLTSTQREEQFNAIQDEFASTLTPEFAARLRARTAGQLATIRANAETFATAAAKVLGTRRAGDQIGHLLAGAYSLHSSKLITVEAAEAWIGEREWESEKQQQEQRDEVSCLNRILTSRVRMKSGEEITLAELVKAASQNFSDGDVSGDEARKVLPRYGLRVEGPWLAVANQHKEIGNVLSDTPWAPGWSAVLNRLDGAKKAGPYRFAGINHRTIDIPISTVLEE